MAGSYSPEQIGGLIKTLRGRYGYNFVYHNTGIRPPDLQAVELGQKPLRGKQLETLLTFFTEKKASRDTLSKIKKGFDSLADDKFHEDPDYGQRVSLWYMSEICRTVNWVEGLGYDDVAKQLMIHGSNPSARRVQDYLSGLIKKFHLKNEELAESAQINKALSKFYSKYGVTDFSESKLKEVEERKKKIKEKIVSFADVLKTLAANHPGLREYIALQLDIGKHAVSQFYKKKTEIKPTRCRKVLEQTIKYFIEKGISVDLPSMGEFHIADNNVTMLHDGSNQQMGGEEAKQLHTLLKKAIHGTLTNENCAMLKQKTPFNLKDLAKKIQMNDKDLSKYLRGLKPVTRHHAIKMGNFYMGYLGLEDVKTEDSEIDHYYPDLSEQTIPQSGEFKRLQHKESVRPESSVISLKASQLVDSYLAAHKIGEMVYELGLEMDDRQREEVVDLVSEQIDLEDILRIQNGLEIFLTQDAKTWEQHRDNPFGIKKK